MPTWVPWTKLMQNEGVHSRFQMAVLTALQALPGMQRCVQLIEQSPETCNLALCGASQGLLEAQAPALKLLLVEENSNSSGKGVPTTTESTQPGTAKGALFEVTKQAVLPFMDKFMNGVQNNPTVTRLMQGFVNDLRQNTARRALLATQIVNNLLQWCKTPLENAHKAWCAQEEQEYMAFEAALQAGRKRSLPDGGGSACGGGAHGDDSQSQQQQQQQSSANKDTTSKKKSKKAAA